jgi:hypothetical protein
MPYIGKSIYGLIINMAELGISRQLLGSLPYRISVQSLKWFVGYVCGEIRS